MNDVKPASELLTRRRGSLDELRKEAVAGRLYAILDACDAPAILERCSDLGPERAVSLYRGSAEEMYWAIAPYLVVADEQMLEWITMTIWNEPWGFFGISDRGLEAVRQFLRRFLVVQAPSGAQWYFRFYDPRVLKRFVLTGSKEQIEQFLPHGWSIAIPHSSPHVTLIEQRQVTHAAKRRIRIMMSSPFLKMSRTQIGALSRRVRKEFKTRLFEFLTDQYPAEINHITGDSIDHFIESGIRAASEYGLSREYHIARFIEYRLLSVAGKQSSPDTEAAVLRLRDLSADMRLDLLLDSLAAEP